MIFITQTNGIAPWLENLQRHLEYQEFLERTGVMFAAGAHWNETVWWSSAPVGG